MVVMVVVVVVVIVIVMMILMMMIMGMTEFLIYIILLSTNTHSLHKHYTFFCLSHITEYLFFLLHFHFFFTILQISCGHIFCSVTNTVAAYMAYITQPTNSVEQNPY